MQTTAPILSSVSIEVPAHLLQAPGISQHPTTSPWKNALLSIGGVLAAIPYLFGLALMWIAWVMQGRPTADDKTSSKGKPLRVEDVDPWTAPPVFWC